MSLKHAIRDRVKQATRHSGLYLPLRNMYQFACNPGSRQYRREATSFFSQFISKNDLVFDVGANVGDYTEIFVGLGGRVVAVEPNARLVPVLKRIRPRDRVAIECMALGSAEGLASLYLCGKDYLATLSRDWISVAEQSDRFAGIKWSQEVAVPVSTLDALIEKYGTPQFIKIDVEGFEKEVLAGLSTLTGFLSFEFNSEFTQGAASCLAQPCFSSDTKFNVVMGSCPPFLFDRWVGRDEILRFLEDRRFVKPHANGDIIACGRDGRACAPREVHGK